ncbi:MAG: hypothetical protein ABIB79_05350 [archaeon]
MYTIRGENLVGNLVGKVALVNIVYDKDSGRFKTISEGSKFLSKDDPSYQEIEDRLIQLYVGEESNFEYREGF